MSEEFSGLVARTLSEVDIFKVLIKNRGYKDLLDFCKKNGITYDPLRKRLKKSELFTAKSNLMLKICQGLGCTAEELIAAFKIAKSDPDGDIAEMRVGVNDDSLALHLLPLANGSKDKIVVPLTSEEAQMMVALRLLKRVKPETYSNIILLVNTGVAQAAQSPGVSG